MSGRHRHPAIPHDKYEILAHGGAGGMGIVYKARHRILDELRAVKVMRDLSAADPDLQQRFLLEARTAARLSHPNLARIYDLAFAEDGTPHMVLEWIDGVDLETLLRRHGPPTLWEAVEIAAQALAALSYLHAEGVVHRDVSTANVMITRSREGALLVKVIDLGIAKSVNPGLQLTGKGQFAGKLRYAAPETLDTARRGPLPDPRSDLYSFGVLLYELLTGEAPFPGPSESDLVAGHLLSPPQPFERTDPGDRVPEELRHLVLRALEKDPEKRFQSAESFRRELMRVGVGLEPSGEESVFDEDTIALSAVWEIGEYRTPDSAPGGGIADAEHREEWFQGLRRRYRERERPESRLTTSVVLMARHYPGRAALIVIAFVSLMGVGVARYWAGGPVGQAMAAAEPPSLEGPVAAPDRAPEGELEGMPSESGTGGLADPGSRSPASVKSRAAPMSRTIALVSDDPTLTTALLEKLGPAFRFELRSSLEDAARASPPDARQVVLRLTGETSAVSLEAYDTTLAACEASATAELVELPERRPIYSRTSRERAPFCREALGAAGSRLADEVSPGLRRAISG